MDIRVLLRHLQNTSSDRRVSRDTGVARITVRRYRQWAEQNALLSEPILPLEELQLRLESTLPRLTPPQNLSSVEPYREIVLELRSQGVEIRAILSRLKERGFEGSYSGIYRFVQALEPREKDVTVRVEKAPGEEAQVDFGEVGRMLCPASGETRSGEIRSGETRSGEIRKTWAFVMTLSFSRHQYVEFVFDQKVETWLLCHVHAFAFFGGAPLRITSDNLKAAIIRAAWDEPTVNRSYAECAEHYGFLLSPCRPYTPQHKGKVESGVHYVQRNFIAGRAASTGKEVNDFVEANRDVRRWCVEEAGKRIHGTTREAPMERFLSTERARLRPLPAAAYDMGVYKEVKLHRDCHVSFEGSWYSAPFRLVGEQVCVRRGLSTVKIYDSAYQLVATHDRAQKAGERHTHIDHYPARKIPGLTQTRQECLEKAAEIGPGTLQVVEEMLGDRVLDKLGTVGRLVRLKEKYTAVRLEAACQRAILFADPHYATIKSILLKELEQEAVSGCAHSGCAHSGCAHSPGPVPTTGSTTAIQVVTPVVAPVVTPAATYARSAEELLGYLCSETGPDAGLEVGGASWN